MQRLALDHPSSGVRRLDPRFAWTAFTVFAAGTSLTGIGVLGLALMEVSGHALGVPILVLGGATVIASRVRVELPGYPATTPISHTLGFLAVLLFGPGAATIVVAIDRLSTWVTRPPQSWRMAFDAAVPVVAIWIAGRVFVLADNAGGVTSPVFISNVAMGAVYFAVRSSLTTMGDVFEHGGRARSIWRSRATFLALTDYATLSLAMLVASLGANSSVDMLSIGGPLVILACITYKKFADQAREREHHATELERLYQAAIETLAIAVDAKDQVTHGHIRRVQRHALALAAALEMHSHDDLRAVEAAALLHDIGKLAVPDYVLNKPGTLTRSEFEVMKIHASKGAAILAGVAFPYPVVPIVRHHHEQWNGRGYPDGLAGEAIPLGARLLAVVDCFDALTSDRPYRRKLSDAAATEILLERSGSHYDPHVVTTFIALVPHLRETDVHADEPAPPEPAAVGVPRPMLSRSVEGTQILKVNLMPDVIGRVLRVRMERLLPDASFCLWLPDEDGEHLRPVHVSQALQATLRSAEVRVGSGLAGWVAANRHTIINSPPDLDLVAGVADAGIRKCVCTPVFACGTIAGVLTAYTSRAEGFSEREVRLAGAIAQEIGLEFSRNDPFLGYDFTALDELAAPPASGHVLGRP